ncbi:MAG: hypothetical protein ACFCUH_07240 [Flavobacteriales bacterium]
MKTLLSLAFACITLSSAAQAEMFSGTVVYTRTNDDRGYIEPPLPNEVVIHSAPGYHRYEEAIGADRRVVIYDLAKGEQYTLMTLLGERIAIRAPFETASAVSSMDAVLTDALPICGWPATSVNINKQSVVYTPRLLSNHPNLPQCGGLVLEFTYPKSSLRFRAATVSTQAPDAALFTIPAGYTLITAEELLEVFGIDGE